MRAEQPEIGACQQMRPILRIDGQDQGGIEKQPNIGPQPSAAKIARTKHPAIRAGIVRPHAASRHGHDQEQQREPIHRCQLFQTTAHISHAAAQPVQFRQRLPRSGLARLFAGSQSDFRHTPAVQGHPGIFGDGIFIGIAQRLVGGDAVLIAAGNLVALLVREELLN
jgi:hypothetical protein